MEHETPGDTPNMAVSGNSLETLDVKAVTV